MSDQEPYTGICIGGPRAGINVTHTLPHFAVAESQPPHILMPDEPTSAPVDVKHHNYRYYGHMFVDGKDVQSFPMWLHDSIETPSDAFAAMAAAYIKQSRAARVAKNRTEDENNR